MHTNFPKPRAVLFDLDGTLADTAPDLAGAMNKLRLRRKLPPVPYALLRPVASAGARGLIGAAFNLAPGDEGYEELRVEFLDTYSTSLVVESSLFNGVTSLLASLRKQDICWGIVTNKAARFTDPLVQLIGLGDASCVISGDTTSHAKPHPAPLIEAATRLKLAQSECWYVGDDLRDIQAGRAAGMYTVAAAWGYCGNAEPDTWGADMLIHTPSELLELLN